MEKTIIILLLLIWILFWAIIYLVYYYFIFIKPDNLWEYGVCNGEHARRHKETGVVQFVLWEKGYKGQETDVWHDFDASHWGFFELKK